jgi:hypothetical protein
VPEQEPTDDGRTLNALLTHLVDRAEHLSVLLDTLERNHRLPSLFAELEQTGRGDALVTVLPRLMRHIDHLEALVAEVLDRPDRMGAVLATLVDHTGKVDALVAELEQAVARSSRDT